MTRRLKPTNDRNKDSLLTKAKFEQLAKQVFTTPKSPSKSKEPDQEASQTSEPHPPDD